MCVNKLLFVSLKIPDSKQVQPTFPYDENGIKQMIE